MEHLPERIPTPLGAEIMITDAPDWLDPGIMLHLRMVDPEDPRHAEVYLDHASLDALILALEAFQVI